MPANRGWKSPYVLLTITMLLWGSAFSSSKSVVAQMPHTVAALLRFGGGAVALLAAVALFGRPGAPASARGGGRAALAGLLGVFAYNGFFFWGLSLAPSLDAGILIPVLSPVLTSAFLLVTGRDRPSGGRLAGLALGLAGAVVFFFGAGGSAHGGATRLTGDLLYLLSAVCWAAYTLIGPRVLAGVDPLRATTYATCAGAVLLGALAAPDLGETHWSELPAGLWLNVVFLAIGPAAVANLLYYRGVGAVGPASASLMMFMVPVINTGCAMLFLGESFGALQALGALVLLSGAVLAVARGRGAARPRVGAAPTAGKKPSEL
ncbi:DMT family transporter [Streptomyces sp. PSAA01]|uniref:DMT family transporter n=1 Tax=Streptomyces sp. PSAA01 TaxID=2912762 RepID=UPI001F394A17|nr:DMT family transporter [Streptomyces sp. PSAA01]MCG0287228.1 DMT family transporter [Streptomyces sp. PSAA01]